MSDNLRNCPICDKNNFSLKPLLVKDDKWAIKCCSSCSFVYLENYATYEDLESEYAWEKTSVIESSSRKKEEPFIYLLSTLFKYVKTNIVKRNKILFLFRRHYVHGKILDIGCAGGGLICELRQQIGRDFTPMGIEISNNLAKEGDANLKKFGGEVIHANAIDGLAKIAPNSISMIIMSSFLEHELQPSLCLKNAYQALAKNGVIIIKVPNYGSANRKVRKEKWCGYRFPDHLNYFTANSLSKLAVDLNFSIRQFNLLDRSPTSDSMYIVLEKL